ncbi:MAG TPA: DinB family protein [Nitrososphaerales archaeon]|nr:DinB family protein [Nitrososphaerales archaeon]
MDTRTRFLMKFREIGWEEFSKNREASWHSMFGIFLHILEVEESWLQFALQGLSPADSPSLDPTEYNNFDLITELNSRVSARTISVLERLKDEDLSKEIAFRESSGITARTTSRILMHAFVDEVAHVGELICLLWQEDAKPPYIDWLDFQIE